MIIINVNSFVSLSICTPDRLLRERGIRVEVRRTFRHEDVDINLNNLVYIAKSGI